jgi:hypothetical protein
MTAYIRLSISIIRRQLRSICTDMNSVFHCLFCSVHLQAYQPELTRRYCQLSSTLDVELSLAQHELRQVGHVYFSFVNCLLLKAVTAGPLCEDPENSD